MMYSRAACNPKPSTRKRACSFYRCIARLWLRLARRMQHEDLVVAFAESELAKGRMEDRLQPAAVSRQRLVRDHRPDRCGQDHVARCDLPCALSPHAAHGHR